MKELARRHLEDLRRKIRELEAMSDTLESLIGACSGDNRPDCPIIADLEQVADTCEAGAAKPRKGAVDLGQRLTSR